jgi:hypothetical protein
MGEDMKTRAFEIRFLALTSATGSFIAILLLTTKMVATAQTDDLTQQRVAATWRALEIAAQSRDWATFRAHCTDGTSALIADLEREASAPWSPNADALDKLAASVGAATRAKARSARIVAVDVRTPNEAALRLIAETQRYVIVFHRENDQWKFDLDDTLSL